jgi:hypothetical protein
MKPYNVDQILIGVKKMMLNEMKKTIQPRAKLNITDDMLKEQINKGWFATKNALDRDRVLCFNCGTFLRTNVDKLKENPKCSFCQKQFSL